VLGAFNGQIKTFRCMVPPPESQEGVGRILQGAVTHFRPPCEGVDNLLCGGGGGALSVITSVPSHMPAVIF
jgi:hypothetical protein